jgi:hypothetical protein
MLYYAPTGTPTDDLDSWALLGAAELPYVDADLLDEVDARTPIAVREFSASVTFQMGGLNPYGYWILFRRRHPRVADMHRAYRRKSRRR